MKRVPIPDGYSLPETDEGLLGECDVSVFRATGPGGQGVNTTDSAVRMKHRLTGIVVVCRRERSQLRNKHDCLKRLRQRLEESMPPPRRPTRPSRAAKERRLTEKSNRASTKATRQRPGAEE